MLLLLRATVFAAFLLSSASGHATVVSPRSRNSIDYLPDATPDGPVNSPKDWPSNKDCANITGDGCHNGQATFWYSQGCFIGCDECDHTSGRRQIDLCGKGMVGTLPAEYRTVNLDSELNSDQDIYKHNPWRAPGNAPTADACGLAGGTPWPQESPEAGDYQTTKYAHHGMNGTLLAPLETGVEWKIGGEGEVTFQISNNHGGGYAYRLCPHVPGQKLTEACFQAHHLDFVADKQAIYHKSGSILANNTGMFISKGTTPPNSMWARIPIPSNCLGPRCIPGPNDTNATLNRCLPGETHLLDGKCVPCPGTPGSDCSRCDNNCQSGKPAFEPHCKNCMGNNHDIAVRDFVKVPAGLTPGRYVLSFRMDCEATAQVWNSCSDITLVQ